MSTSSTSLHGVWSGKLAFVLAATGSAVGLGNIWKFPYMAGENGGGAFVLVYLLCIAFIGLPILLAETVLGRMGGQSPINTMRKLGAEFGRTRLWALVGWAGVVAGFIILSFYSVIAGWVISYAIKSATGLFDGVTADAAATLFQDLAGDAERQLGWHTIFMVMTALVVSRGVERGLESAARIMMPLLLILLLGMVAFGLSTGSFGTAVNFLFAPDFSQISGAGVIAAMGHAFFSLSLGIGAMMMYGAYVPRQTDIIGAGITIAVADTLIALLAGLAVFPVVFANGLDPQTGPTLIFQSLPLAFSQMPAGTWIGLLFFVLLILAAWTSAISLIEPVVVWLVESRGLTRANAVVWVAFAAWFVGIGTILSFNHWAELRLYGNNFFETANHLTANILLPIGGFFIALFAAWFLSRDAIAEQLGLNTERGYKVWRIMVGVVAPTGVIVVFVSGLGLID